MHDSGRALQSAQYGGVKDWMDGCLDVELLMTQGYIHPAGPCEPSNPFVVQASFTNPKFSGTDDNNTLFTGTAPHLSTTYNGFVAFQWVPDELLQFKCRRAEDTFSFKIFSGRSSTACDEIKIIWHKYADYDSKKPQLSATDPAYWKYYEYKVVRKLESQSSLYFKMAAYPAHPTPAPVRDASNKAPVSKSTVVSVALFSSLSLLALAVVYFRRRRRLSANPTSPTFGASPPTSPPTLMSDLPAPWYYTTALVAAPPVDSALAPASARYDAHPPPTAPGYLPQAPVATAVAVALSTAEAGMVWEEGGGDGVLAEARWEPEIGRGSAGESSTIV